MKFILGKKIGMTQLFQPSGEVVAVTKVQAGPCPIVQIKDDKRDNATAVQVGFDQIPDFRLTQPRRGHLKGLSAVRYLKDFSLSSTAGLERGDIIAVDTFAVGERVAVSGVSKGKGFAGVVKRHHFKGGPASHGHKDNLRAPGAIGSGGVQRVFKGVRMGGQMGNAQVTVKNLEIAAVDAAANELYIKGALPGGRGGLLIIEGEGELKVTKKTVPEALAEVKPELSPVADVG